MFDHFVKNKPFERLNVSGRSAVKPTATKRFDPRSLGFTEMLQCYLLPKGPLFKLRTVKGFYSK